TLRPESPMYVHIHSQDAAGNQEKTQTIELPLASIEPALEFTVEAGARCVVGRAVATVRVFNEDDVPMSVVIDTPYGARSFDDVAPGKSSFHAFTTRQVQIPAALAVVEVAAVVDGKEVTATLEVPYATFS